MEPPPGLRYEEGCPPVDRAGASVLRMTTGLIPPRRSRRRSGAWRTPCAAAALLLATACLHARGTAEAPAVVAVDLEGVKAVDADDLRERLATRESDRLPWGEVRHLDPDALLADRGRVVAYYKQRGYYRAEVDEPEVRPDGEGRVRVVIRVREGAPVRVARVDVLGLDAAPEARAAVGKLAIAPGDVFTWGAYDAARAQLATALGATGWANATVTPEAVVRASEGTADVVYRVEPGQRFKFGPVAVSGTEDVPRDKIEARAVRLAPQGAWWDEGSLERIQARVFELGVFQGVRVTRGTPDPERGEVPVNVNVREAPFRTLRVGPGIGLEPSRWEVLGQASWINRNWLGDLERLRFDLRGGYAWIPSPYSTIRAGWVGTLGAEFSQPGVMFGDAVDFFTRVELERDLEQAYASVSQKIRIGVPFRPAPRWTVVPSYNLEIYKLSDFVGDPAQLPVENCQSTLCVLSFLEQRITYDRRDHPLFTTRGYLLGLTVQEGFPAAGYGYTYLKFIPEARWFTPPRRGSVLALRVRYGALVPLHESGPAPVVGLFTSGGPSSMRGYGSERLAPMVLQDGAWVPTGGNGLLEASAEYRHSLGGDLVGAVFLDGGNVSIASGNPSQARDVWDLSKFQLAVGYGIRYRTSVGPLRADLAVRLPNDFSKGVPFEERFPAVPGNSGHREPIAVLHIGLGEAF
jgi:translocation and assembly module TamA